MSKNTISALLRAVYFTRHGLRAQRATRGKPVAAMTADKEMSNSC
jgi:hypothetical protein